MTRAQILDYYRVTPEGRTAAFPGHHPGTTAPAKRGTSCEQERLG